MFTTGVFDAPFALLRYIYMLGGDFTWLKPERYDSLHVQDGDKNLTSLLDTSPYTADVLTSLVALLLSCLSFICSEIIEFNLNHFIFMI